MATTYTVRWPLADLIVRGVDTLVEAPVYAAGTIVTPTAATVTVYDSAGTVVVATTAATITGGVATYTILGTVTSSLALAEGWRIEWVITLPDSSIIRPRNEAALVRVVPYPVVTDRDIAQSLAYLDPRAAGALAPRGHQPAIDEAWLRVQAELIERGGRPWLVVGSHALRRVHLLTALALALEGMASPTNGFGQAAKDKWAEVTLAWGTVSMSYDRSDTGTPDVPRATAAATVWLTGR